MGCDIHAYIETKVQGDWVFIGQVKSAGGDRDYEFFTHLCGVRNYNGDDDNWPTPRGIPQDVSNGVQFYADRISDDGHSHSYESAQSFMEKKLALMRIKEQQATPNNSTEWMSWTILGYEIVKEYDNIDDYRVIYWFDN